MQHLKFISSRINQRLILNNFISRKLCNKRSFHILGIETSCDDTGVAIVNSNGDVLGKSLHTDFAPHETFGGIVPNIAKRVHQEKIDLVLESALNQSSVKMKDIDGIAVAIGPGLSPCLRVGVNKAVELCKKFNKPFIGVNHLEGHALVVRMMKMQDRLPFPFLTLLLSGGHSQILVCKGVGDYIQLGTTLDDSMGECFDKVARMLNVNISQGGMGLELLAKNGDPNSFQFRVPIKQYKNCDLSFSGLKTNVLYTIKEFANKQIQDQDPNLDLKTDLNHVNKKIYSDIASSFQNTAIQHIIDRTARSMAYSRVHFNDLTNVVVCGGVARNQSLRDQLGRLCEDESLIDSYVKEFKRRTIEEEEKDKENSKKFKVIFPPMDLCTDNGVMIAWAGLEMFENFHKNFPNGANSDEQQKSRIIMNTEDLHRVEVYAKFPLDSNQSSSELFENPYRSYIKKRNSMKEK